MLIRAAAVVLASLILASDARAQIDTPSFLPPRPGDNIGVYLTDVGGADFALQGIWRQGGNLNLGLRVGYIEIPGAGAIVVGAESWGLLAAAGPRFPVDVAWTLGAGAAFNGGTLLEVPAGLSIGRVFDVEPITLQVYAHPRLALFVEPDAANADDELDVGVLFDIGADAAVNENLTVRLGITSGKIDAVGIGLAYRWSRNVVVR